MNRTPNRFGNEAGAVGPAKDGSDWSHGKAMVTPAPRRTVRREMRLELVVRLRILFTFLFRGLRFSPVQELGARDNRLHQGVESIVIRGQHGSHFINRELIGKQQRPSQGIGK